MKASQRTIAIISSVAASSALLLIWLAKRNGRKRPLLSADGVSTKGLTGITNTPVVEATTNGACSACDCGRLPPSHGALEGTMEPFENQVVICTGTSEWPAAIETDEGSVASMLNKQLTALGLVKKKKKGDSRQPPAKVEGKEEEEKKNFAAIYRDFQTPSSVWKTTVRLTACTEASQGPPGTVDLILFPQQLRVTVEATDEALGRFLEAAFVSKDLCVEGPSGAALEVVPLEWSHLILVCIHGTRDQRCGRAGPQVIDSMTAYWDSLVTNGDPRVKELNVAIRGCSHLGGHKFAGVCIVLPQADWYGLVTKKIGTELIEKCVIAGKVLLHNWRGNQSGKQVESCDFDGLATLRDPPQASISISEQI